MPEALKCPSCAAPLDYPPGGGATMRCPYCNTTVMLPGAPTSGASQIAGKTKDLRLIIALMRAGKEIEAIKIYRAGFGGDLASAKAEVERIAAGHAAVIGATSVRLYNTSGPNNAAASVRIVLRVAVSLILAIVFIVAIVAQTIHKQLAVHKTPTIPMAINIPSLPAMPSITEPGAPPAPPAFAHSTLEFGTEGIGAGQFKDSRSIAIDGAGHIYVGEYSDGRIQVFDPQGKFLAEWSVGHQKYLLNLTADRRGTLYAVIPGSILRYEGATGMPLGEVEKETHDEMPESYTDAFAALDGDIYAIAGSSDIVILSNDGHIKSVISGSDKVGEDVSFERIAVVSTGEIYTLDRTRGIFKFAPDGRYINRFGGGEDEHGFSHLIAAQNLTVDGNGHVYVSSNSPAIQVFTGDGEYLNSFGGDDVAFGLTINDQNEIYACFRNEHQVRKYVLDKR